MLSSSSPRGSGKAGAIQQARDDANLRRATVPGRWRASESSRSKVAKLQEWTFAVARANVGFRPVAAARLQLELVPRMIDEAHMAICTSRYS